MGRRARCARWARWSRSGRRISISSHRSSASNWYSRSLFARLRASSMETSSFPSSSLRYGTGLRMRESFAFSADGDSGAMSRARETERSLLRGRGRGRRGAAASCISTFVDGDRASAGSSLPLRASHQTRCRFVTRSGDSGEPRSSARRTREAARSREATPKPSPRARLVDGSRRATGKDLRRRRRRRPPPPPPRARRARRARRNRNARPRRTLSRGSCSRGSPRS